MSILSEKERAILLYFEAGAELTKDTVIDGMKYEEIFTIVNSLQSAGFIK